MPKIVPNVLCGTISGISLEVLVHEQWSEQHMEYAANTTSQLTSASFERNVRGKKPKSFRIPSTAPLDAFYTRYQLCQTMRDTGYMSVGSCRQAWCERCSVHMHRAASHHTAL